MMNNQPLAPDELFRRYQRGMLDQHSLFSQILLNMIDLAETQQAHSVLLEAMSETLTGLSQDIATLYDLLRMRRPSQAEADEHHDDGTGSDEDSAEDSTDGGDK
jgi:hypothetical protein